jgi:hypothetical protein
MRRFPKKEKEVSPGVLEDLGHTPQANRKYLDVKLFAIRNGFTWASL